MGRKGIAALLAAGAVAAGLLVAPGLGSAAPARSPHRAVTKVHNANGTVVAPSRIHPGLVHLRNTGGGQIGIFGRKNEGATELARYLNSRSGRQEKKAFRRFDFVTVMTGHQDTWVRLLPRVYYLANLPAFSDRKITASSLHVLTVLGGPSVNAKRPRRAAIAVDSGGRITRSVRGRVGDPIEFRNRSYAARLHFPFRVRNDVTDVQLQDFLNHPSPDKLFRIARPAIGGLTKPLFAGRFHTVIATTGLASGRFITTSIAPTSPSFALRRGTVGVLTLR